MNEDLLDLFIEESRELVTRAQDDLVALETNAGDAAVLDSLFRAIHTLKGSVALFDWPPFAHMLHVAEDLLSAIRAGQTSLDEQSVDALGACITQTELWLNALEAHQVLPADSAARAAPVTRALKQALDASANVSAAPDHCDELLARALEHDPKLKPPLFVITCTPARDSYIAGEDPVAIAQAAPGLIDLAIHARAPWGDLDDYDPYACNLVITLLSNATREELDAAFAGLSGQVDIRPAQVPDPAPLETKVPETTLERRTMRVDAARIDALVHTIDEMIVAKNALSQLAAECAQHAGEDFARKLRDHQAAIGRLTARMHAAVTSMRLVQIGPTLRRLPRMARDLGAKLGKPVDVVLDCEEIEADKAMIDGLAEPLLHLMRNAIDHGVETPDERRAAGKPARGRIALSARRHGDQILIRVEDDGRGIEAARIREVARARALLPEAALDALDDKDALALIFLPGFSTASSVSDVSGRGVGMDAVRVAVARLGGRVDLVSTPGAGTSVTLTLPLSMMMTQVAVVACGGDVYGVPIDDIVELALVPAREISDVRNGKAFFLRERPVPLVSLEHLLGCADRAEDDNLRILVIRAGDDWVGVSVQQLVERMEAVVSPVGGLLTGMRGVAGTTLMGNGSVLIVLDVPELLG